MSKNPRTSFDAARQYVITLAEPRLQKLGFSRRPHHFELALTDHQVGVVCFSIGAIDPIDVSIVVGVRFDKVESLVARLHGSAANLSTWTVGAPLADLATYEPWRRTRFDGTDADEVRMSEVVQDLEHYGLPFMKKWSDLSTLIHHMRRMLDGESGAERYVTDPSTTLPVALILCGQEKEARAIVRETVASLPLIKNRGYAMTYSRFAEALENMVR